MVKSVAVAKKMIKTIMHNISAVLTLSYLYTGDTN
jgi:hypothetical protein